MDGIQARSALKDLARAAGEEGHTYGVNEGDFFLGGEGGGVRPMPGTRTLVPSTRPTEQDSEPHTLEKKRTQRAAKSPVFDIRFSGGW